MKFSNFQLPIKIDIIKHKHEIDGKATSTHAAILASEDVQMYNYPDIPDYSKEDGVVLIFPSPKSVSISCIFTGNSELQIKENFRLPRGYNLGTFQKNKLKEIGKEGEENEGTEDFRLYGSEIPIKKAVFIDSTWNQSRSIYKDVRINSLKCVILQNRISQFWRHQKGSPRWYLATIEAVHQFLLEAHINAWGVSSNYIKYLDQLQINTDFIPRCKIIQLEDEKESKEVQEEIIKPYEGQYDNLLFFFSHMYDLIHSHYDHELLRSYKRPFS